MPIPGITASRLREHPPEGSDLLVAAPGRANLMGEYTDVNNGHVLPVALELQTVIASRRTAARTLRLRSADMPEAAALVELPLDDAVPAPSGWGAYVAAVLDVLRTEGLELQGADGVLASEVPVGAGLSSSAALEVAVALTVLVDPPPAAVLARLCQRAENEGVGVQSGIMDQLASAAAEQGRALFLDCRSLAVEQVVLPAGLGVLVIDSGVGRELAGSGYNERRSQCDRAAADLGVQSLRDATSEQLEQAAAMDPVVRRRARHVLTEERRVLDTVRALREGDLAAVRQLFADSHSSMRDDFEISTPEIDTLVALAAHTPGVVGCRLTGAGFGGSAVALVESAGAETAARSLTEAYAAATSRTPRWWLSGAGAGATRRRLA